MASYRQQDEDAFIDQDIGYPNPESEYRRYRYMRAFVWERESWQSFSG